MSTKLIDRDLGWKEFVQNVARMGDARVKVGVMDDGEDYPEGITVAEVAAINEFGTEDGRIPERSFLRSTFDEKREELLVLAEMLTQRILFGKSTVEDAMNVLGATLASAIKKTIADGVDPPNAESTARRKAATGKTAKYFNKPAETLGDALAQVGALAAVKPLVDTGRLMGSITWAVEKK